MKRHFRSRGCAVLVAVALSIPFPALALWEQYGGGAERNHSTANLNALALYRRWRTVLPGPVHSPAAISGGTVYVGCDDGRLYALDFRTGEERWVYAPENGARIRSGPALSVGLVVAAAADGVVYAVDAASGTEKWRLRAGLSVTSSIAISGDRVIVAAYEGRVCSVSLSSGAVQWDYVIPGDFVSGSPVVGGGMVFVSGLGTGQGGGAVYALDEVTGALRWKTPLPGWLGNTMALSGDRLAVAASGFKTGGLYLLDANDGAILWGPVRGPNNYWSAPAASADTVYAGNTGWLYAVDIQTGSLKWTWKGPSVTRKVGTRTSRFEALIRTPVVSGDRVYAAAYYEVPGPDEIYVISAASGETLWENPIPWRVSSDMAGEDGNLFLGGASGEFEAWSGVGLVVNGKAVEFGDVAPVLVEGRTWVPVRALFESAGFRVSWDESSRRVTCTNGERTIEMGLDSPDAVVDGLTVDLGGPARMIGGRLMVQPRAVVAALGGEVEWDPVAYNVIVRLGTNKD